MGPESKMAGVLIRRGDQDTWGEMPGIQTHTEKKAVWRQREKVWFASQGRGASWSQPYEQLNLDCLQNCGKTKYIAVV